MAFSTVQKAVLSAMDRFAYQVQASGYAMTGGTDIWTRADATGDETYENCVCNANATALDAVLLVPDLGDLAEMDAWLSDLGTYMAGEDTTIPDFFADLMLRVDESTAAILTSAGYALATVNKHARSDAGASAPGRCLGTFILGGSMVAAADIDTAAASASPVLGRVTKIGTDNWTVTGTFKVTSEANEAVEQVVVGSGTTGAVGDTYVFGAEAVTSEAAAAQKIILMSATAQFSEGQTVLITEWTGSAPTEAWAQQEYGVVASVDENTSITVTTNLLHTYSTDAFVYPCFIGGVSATSSGGTAADAIAFYPAPDRRLAL